MKLYLNHICIRWVYIIRKAFAVMYSVKAFQIMLEDGIFLSPSDYNVNHIKRVFHETYNQKEIKRC
jgi:hypothetical protein